MSVIAVLEDHYQVELVATLGRFLAKNSRAMSEYTPPVNMIEELAKQKIIQNNWYEKDQEWYCPKANERRAHELY